MPDTRARVSCVQGNCQVSVARTIECKDNIFRCATTYVGEKVKNVEEKLYLQTESAG